MSKLSPALKAAISAAFAKPNTVAAPKSILSVYKTIQDEATSKDVGLPSFLAISTAATMTMNSPDSLTELHQVVSASSNDQKDAIYAAEFMREVGLKCISFNGIPRSINCLGAFRSSLPSTVAESLATKPTRMPSTENINAINQRGKALWESIYTPFDSKLIDKLSQSHPDLPIHILYSHYGPLLADFPQHVSGAKVGRVLTSIVAIACLRAQTGVGPQVTSHIFGLRKAYEDGSYKAQGEEEVKGGTWLASDEGSLWILKAVDRIVEAIGEGRGSTFAPGFKSKL
jgi:hypothetical protein